MNMSVGCFNLGFCSQRNHSSGAEDCRPFLPLKDQDDVEQQDFT